MGTFCLPDVLDFGPIILVTDHVEWGWWKLKCKRTEKPKFTNLGNKNMWQVLLEGLCVPGADTSCWGAKLGMDCDSDSQKLTVGYKQCVAQNGPLTWIRSLFYHWINNRTSTIIWYMWLLAIDTRTIQSTPSTSDFISLRGLGGAHVKCQISAADVGLYLFLSGFCPWRKEESNKLFPA